jgi:DNA-binding transcriptional MerR regulator
MTMENASQFSVGDLAKLFDVSRQTIRQWSSEFKHYLSPRANPGKNRVRAYSEDDLPIFSLVAQMKNIGHTYEDIHVALANGQRGEMPDVENTALRHSKLEQRIRDLQQTAGTEIAISYERAQAALERVSELETMIEQASDERDFWRERATKAEETLNQLEQDLHAKEIDLVRLQGRVEALEHEREQVTIRDQEMLKMQRSQLDRLEAERTRLTQELMAIYRRLALSDQSRDNSPPNSTGSTSDTG